MLKLPHRTAAFCVCLIALLGCEKKPDEKADGLTPGAQELVKSGEHIDADQLAMASKVTRAYDPIQKEISDFCHEVRAAFDRKDFAWLDKTTAEICEAKAVFGNGSWKIYQFYEGFALPDNAGDAAWGRDAKSFEAWEAAEPASLTAQIAHANFLVDYAWRARGDGYSDSVTMVGRYLFEKRLESAHQILEKAHKMSGHDPVQWLVALTVARGQGLAKPAYDAMVVQAKTYEPKFWGYDSERAVSLLPRWYGQPGEWEAYAEKAAARPDGLGDEIYARIVVNLRGYHGNIFQESRASWPKTLKGLELMRERYPQSKEIISNAAYLAATAGDRPTASNMFDAMGKDFYLESVWRRPEQFAHVQHWVLTGSW
jgi:hypothetical protein